MKEQKIMVASSVQYPAMLLGGVLGGFCGWHISLTKLKPRFINSTTKPNPNSKKPPYTKFHPIELLGLLFGVALGAWPGVLLRWGMAGIVELEEDLEEIFHVRRIVVTIVAIILLVLYYLIGLYYVINIFTKRLGGMKNRSGGKYAHKKRQLHRKEKKLKDELDSLITPPWLLNKIKSKSKSKSK